MPKRKPTVQYIHLEPGQTEGVLNPKETTEYRFITPVGTVSTVIEVGPSNVVPHPSAGILKWHETPDGFESDKHPESGAYYTVSVNIPGPKFKGQGWIPCLRFEHDGDFHDPAFIGLYATKEHAMAACEEWEKTNNARQERPKHVPRWPERKPRGGKPKP